MSRAGEDVVADRWRCGHTNEVWEGDISNHHGIEPGEGWCPGPHLPSTEPLTDHADDALSFLRRLNAGAVLHADGTVTDA